MRWHAAIAPWRNRRQAPCFHQKDASPKEKPVIFFDNNVPMLRLFKNKKPLVQNTAKMDEVYKSLQDSYLNANAYFCHFRVDAHAARLRRNGISIEC